jgi:hypothetical protein
VKAERGLRRVENGEHSCGTTEVKQATAAGVDRLVVAGTEAKEVAELVVAATKAWTAAMSRCSLAMVSTRLPSRSMARYRYAQRPRTFR